MGDISYVDSSGIGELMSAHTRVFNRGAKVKLFHIGKRVEDLLHITKLNKVFEVFENEAEAIRSF